MSHLPPPREVRREREAHHQNKNIKTYSTPKIFVKKNNLKFVQIEENSHNI